MINTLVYHVLVIYFNSYRTTHNAHFVITPDMHVKTEEENTFIRVCVIPLSLSVSLCLHVHQ